MPNAILPMMVELSGYEDLELVGSGGNAHVYRGVETETGRHVAIKILRAGDDPAVLRRFRRERRLMEELDGFDLIVPVLKISVTAADDPFLVMPFFEGGSLQRLLDEHDGGLPIDEALRMAALIARALERAHGVDVLHRDLKPANILLDDEMRPWLADFGIAEFAGSTASMSGAMMTPAFSAPESFLDQKPTRQSDVFGFGALLFTMLAGRPPFGGNEESSPGAVMNRVLNDAAPVELLPIDTPEAVVRTVELCLSKDPSERPAEIGLVGEWLEAAARGEAPPVPAGSAGPTVARPDRAAGPILTGEVSSPTNEDGGSGRRALISIAALLLIVALVGAGAALSAGAREGTASGDSTIATEEETGATSTIAPEPQDSDAASTSQEDDSPTTAATSQQTTTTVSEDPRTDLETEVLPQVETSPTTSEPREPTPTSEAEEPEDSSPPPPGAPVAMIGQSSLVVEIDEPISFTNRSTGEVASIEWTFGDGASSSDADATHQYVESGEFVVSLTVAGPGGNDTASVAITVRAPAVDPPAAAFNVSATSVFIGQSVTFTDRTTGNVSSWDWDFGGTGDSTTQSPSHSFASAGTFTVTMTATGEGGTDTSSASITVRHAPPVASFDISATTVIQGTTVFFTDRSTGTITSRTWTYGDGSSGGTASHRYDIVGSFTVTLKVDGPGGTDSVSRTITVEPAPPPAPVANIRILPPNDFGTKTFSLAQHDEISFENASSGQFDSVSWSMGGETFNDTPNFGVVFRVPGDYVIGLTVSGPGGSSTDQVFITVIGLE